MSDRVSFLHPSHASPPAMVDPRRSGAVVGLVGACVFVFSYTNGWIDPITVTARLLTAGVVVLTLLFLYAWPRYLGPFIPARPGRLVVYVLCVLGELALIALGTRWLVAIGQGELRPALIAAVVGLHFLPFGWAFTERMFVILGSVLIVLGAVGLVLGTSGSTTAAAVLSGIAMAGILLAYSLGAFIRRRPSTIEAR